MTKSLKTAVKKIGYFFDQKLQFTYPQSSIKNIQATGEALSPQKRTSSASKHEIYFSIFVGHFCPPGSDPYSESGSGSTELIESGSNSDPDPKHRFFETVCYTALYTYTYTPPSRSH
jgi:hypothetical protein